MVDARVAALCVHRKTVYRSIPGVECYDAERDARTFRGGLPVVAHPPCRTWSRHRRGLAKAPSDEPELAFLCRDWVRKEGGVLEHPAGSHFWEAGGLPLPRHAPDRWGGYTIEVWQWWFGYGMRKRTWLYICGVEIERLPEIPLRLWTPGDAERIRAMSSRQRSETVREFAEWLVQVARLCRGE